MTKKLIFDTKEYDSNDGMLTSVWGPALWHSLHIISFNYPIKPSKEEQTNYHIFFTSLKNVLPCRYCRENYEKNLEIKPITNTVLKNRLNLSKWLFDMHELVNTHLGKKSDLTYEEVRDRYEQFRSRCLINPTPEKIIKKGCSDSLYGVKSKCVINIVPNSSKRETFAIHKKSKITKIKK